MLQSNKPGSLSFLLFPHYMFIRHDHSSVVSGLRMLCFIHYRDRNECFPSSFFWLFVRRNSTSIIPRYGNKFRKQVAGLGITEGVHSWKCIKSNPACIKSIFYLKVCTDCLNIIQINFPPDGFMFLLCLRVWDALCDGLVRSLVLTSGSLRLSYPSSVTQATPESRCRYMLFCKCCWPGDIDTVQSVHSRNPCRQDPHVLKRPSIFKSSRSHFVNVGVAFFMDRTMKHNVWIVNNPPFKATPSFFHLLRPVSRILHLTHSSSKSFTVAIILCFLQ